MYSLGLLGILAITMVIRRVALLWFQTGILVVPTFSTSVDTIQSHHFGGHGLGFGFRIYVGSTYMVENRVSMLRIADTKLQTLRPKTLSRMNQN